MRQARFLQALEPLLQKPYFTAREAKKLGVSAAVLGHYANTSRLKRVRRGVYQNIHSHAQLSLRWDDLIESVLSTKNSVVCLLSALAVYELTEEIPREHWLAIQHTTSAPCRRGIKIVRFRDFDLGMTEISLEGVNIPIYDRERTIVDAFRLLSAETAIKALRMALGKRGKNRLDLRKLEAYAKKLRVNIAPYMLSLTT